jgi:hypothetical protein
VSARQDKEITDFGKTEREIFCVRGLGNPNQLEKIQEIAFLAHATLREFCLSARIWWSKIQLIWRDSGKTLGGVVKPTLAGGFGLLSLERILQALWSGHEAIQRGGNPSLS